MTGVQTCALPISSARKTASGLTALNVNAIDYYLPLLKQAQCEALLKTNGSLLVFEQTPVDEVRKVLTSFTDAGVNASMLDKEQVKAMEPGLKDTIEYAIYFPDVAHTVDPQQLCFKLAELANSLGMTFMRAEVTQIDYSADKVSLTINNQTEQFDQLVVATGVWSKRLCQQLGYPLPMQAERGYHIELAHHKSLSMPVSSAERKFIMTPMENGLRVAGTVEYAALASKPNYQRTKPLQINAQAILDDCPEVRDEATSRWMGNRPSLPDSLPVICRAPAHEKVFFAFGHHHLGLTQGAITGKLIGQLADGEQTDIDVAPFSISRFN